MSDRHPRPVYQPVGFGRSIPADVAGRDSFWAKVDMLGDCWVWTGARTSWGYGKVGYSGRQFGAHRCSYEFAYGKLPDGLFVCHHCDNPPCVNPLHLYAGRPKDNTADMYRRGRAGLLGAEGSANSHAVLTETEVVDIRTSFAAGGSTRELADKYAVTTSAINDVVRGTTWRHIGGPICTTDRRGRHGNHARGAQHPKTKRKAA